MHLLIPFASALSDAAMQVVRDMPLPHLATLLATLSPTQRDDGDERSFSPPHERALAAAWDWHGADGGLPFAARSAAADGIDVGTAAWGLLTPAHWHVARDHVSLADPLALNLTEAESRAAFEAVRALFESEGLRVEWGATLRWYVAHDSLAGLPCAALDRVIGRRVELWTGSQAQTTPAAALMRRLQSEVQMLLYPHTINEAREARGEPAVNSVWLWGAGARLPESAEAPFQSVTADDPVALGYAQAAGLRHRPLPAHADEWLARQIGRAHV